jgi:hypothetical protein
MVILVVSSRVGQTTLRNSIARALHVVREFATLHRLQRDDDAERDRDQHDQPARRGRELVEHVERRDASDEDRDGCDELYCVQRACAAGWCLFGHSLTPGPPRPLLPSPARAAAAVRS